MLFAMVLVAVVTAIVMVVMSMEGVALAMVVAVMPPVAYAILRRPNVTTYFVMFLVYLNVPVILTRFHGVPFIVGVAIPAMLFIPIGYEILFRRQPIIIAPALPWAVLFVVIQAISALFSRDPVIGFGNVVTSVTEGLMVFILITNAVRTPEILRGVVWSLVAAGALMGMLCGYQFFTKTYGRNYGGFAQVSAGIGFQAAAGDPSRRQRRLAGPIGKENRFAQNMLMLVPLALYRFRGEKSSLLRIAGLIAMLLIGLGFSLAFSRGAMVGLVLMVGVMAVCRYVRIRDVVLVGVALLVMLMIVPQYRTRLMSLQKLAGMGVTKNDNYQTPDSSMRGRATEMLAAAWVFADHPVIGVGPRMFKYYSAEYGNDGGMKGLEGTREAHCLYLGLAADTGVLGIFAFGAMLFVTLRELSKVRRQCLTDDPFMANLATGFILVITAYMTTGIFAHFSYIRYFWVMLALAGSAAYVARDRIAARQSEQRATASNLTTIAPSTK